MTWRYRPWLVDNVWATSQTELCSCHSQAFAIDSCNFLIISYHFWFLIHCGVHKTCDDATPAQFAPHESVEKRHVDDGQKIDSLGIFWPVWPLRTSRVKGHQGISASGHQGKGILVDQATGCWSARTRCTKMAKDVWNCQNTVCQGVAKSCKISRPCCSHWGHLGTTITAGFYGKTTTRRGGQWIVFASCSKIHKDHQTSTSHNFT